MARPLQVVAAPVLDDHAFNEAHQALARTCQRWWARWVVLDDNSQHRFS
jgi:hypothetical protein